MYAILETGGKQYKVQTGDVIEVERLDGEVGAQVELGRVLMLSADDEAPKFGNPAIEGARVFGEVVEQGRGDKIIVFKYKPKVRYRRKTGHRQSVLDGVPDAGDTFRVVVEKRYKDQEFIQYGRILAAEYKGKAGRFKTFFWLGQPNALALSAWASSWTRTERRSRTAYANPKRYAPGRSCS